MKERVGVLLALMEDAGSALLAWEGSGFILIAITWALVGVVVGAQIVA